MFENNHRLKKEIKTLNTEIERLKKELSRLDIRTTHSITLGENRIFNFNEKLRSK